MDMQTDNEMTKQYEMPFAIVEGEPVTELPQDLYIPPFALKVFLEAFEGPLDLLIYLIRRQNLDILDIPITDITKQYIDYINLMEEIRLELAGEYLLMAAMLAEIKSKMLLPRPELLEEEDDPRAELVKRLHEYEQFKKENFYFNSYFSTINFFCFSRRIFILKQTMGLVFTVGTFRPRDQIERYFGFTETRAT